MKRILLVAAVSAFLRLNSGFSFVGICAGANEPEVSGTVTNPMLHVSGSQLVDAQGKPVIVRGVNLGGWLMWEGWMFGKGFVSESEIVKKLDTLAGFIGYLVVSFVMIVSPVLGQDSRQRTRTQKNDLR